MRTLAVVLALLALAAPASAQERRSWDLRSLTDPRPEKRGPRIGFRPVENDGGETEAQDILGDDVAEVLRQVVDADSWDSGVNSLDFADGMLHATAGPEVLKKLATAIALLEARTGRTVVVEMEMIELAPGALDGVAPGLLEEAAAAGLRAAAADKARGRVAHRLVARGGAGRFALASSLRRRTYVKDYDIEIAQQASVPDPIMGEVQEGSILEVRPHFSSTEDVLHLELLVQTARLTELQEFKTPATSGGRVELPRVDATDIRTYVAVPVGRTVLLAATDYRASTPGWTTAVLVRARVEGAPAPAAERAVEGDVLRAYSVGALLRLPWLGIAPPVLGLEDPQEEKGMGG